MGVEKDATVSAGSGSVDPGRDEDLPAGTQVGEYVVETKLGEGGFGTVYRATHPLIGKTAAVKVLNRALSSNHEMVSRFVAEARAVNQIRHRNIIDIFAFGQLPDGRQYYIMELLEGLPFDKHLESVKRMDLATAMQVFRPVARALDAAHKAGIVHRDMKPENIFLVTQEDGTFFPKLLDFGIAKLLPGKGTDQGHHKTRTGMQMGTPYYMSPEQCRGIGVDHRTDIYAFGVMIHRVLTGEMPFDGETLMDIMLKHMQQEPPRLSQYGFPPALDDALQRMMAKDPNHRPQTVTEAIDALQQAAVSAGFDASKLPQTTGVAKAVTSGPTGTQIAMDMSVRSTPSGSRSVLVALGIAAVVAIAGGVFLLVGYKEPTTASQPASSPAAPAPTKTEAEKPIEKPIEKTSAPAPSPSPAPAAAATAMMTFETTPKGAEVWLGDTKVGTAPGPLPFAASSAPIEVTVKAPGFAPKTQKVAVKDGASISVTLVPQGGKTTKGPNPVHKDLETPF